MGLRLATWNTQKSGTEFAWTFTESNVKDAAATVDKNISAAMFQETSMNDIAQQFDMKNHKIEGRRCCYNKKASASR